MRKVKFTAYPKKDYAQYPDKYEGMGLFHQWGQESIDTSDGVMNFTVAIIEDENTGQVYTATPKNVKFLPNNL